MPRLQKMIEIDAFKFEILNTKPHMRLNPELSELEAQEELQEFALEQELPDLIARNVTILLPGEKHRGQVIPKTKMIIAQHSGSEIVIYEMTLGEWLIESSSATAGFKVVSAENVESGNI